MTDQPVAALYIDPRGPYPSISGVDAYGLQDGALGSRNANCYRGPWPVVSHPPCGPWSKLRNMRIVSRHDDAACMPHAIAAVRKFGGVLEQPAGSKAFEQFGLPRPGEPADQFGGKTVAVEQVEWGHVARKPTWLYVVGTDAIEPPPFPGRQPTHWCSGFREHSRRGQSGSAVPPGIKVCSAQQRRRTPQLFAEYLVRLARSAKVGG